MGGKTDIAKGRFEEAVGALTNDDHLRNKGRVDQEVGKAMEVFQQVADATKDAADKTAATAKKAAANSRTRI